MIADIGKGFGGESKERSAAELARAYLGGRDGRIADALVRDRVAQIEMDQRCLDWTLARSRDTAKAGHAPGPETSIFKYYGTELNKRRRELKVSILGPQALGWEGDGFSRRGARAHPRLAALARQLDRGRDVGDPAQHHRQAGARTAGLKT